MVVGDDKPYDVTVTAKDGSKLMWLLGLTEIPRQSIRTDRLDRIPSTLGLRMAQFDLITQKQPAGFSILYLELVEPKPPRSVSISSIGKI
jgi:hypothetical protein